MITTITNNPYWEQAVRLFLHNAEAIIANPYILSDEENEWMLQEASIIQREELEKLQIEKENEGWGEYASRIWAELNERN